MIFDYGLYACLFLTVLLLWAPKIKSISLWWFTAALTLTLGLLSNRICWVGIIPILFLAITSYFFAKKKKSLGLKIILASLVFLSSIGLSMHLFPGIHNLKVLDNVFISENAIPFSLYLNIDKTFVGIFILGFTHQLITNKQQWIKMLYQSSSWILLTILITMIFSFAFGLIQVDIKLPKNLLLWSATNLFFVCFAEEAFFRGFIQKNLVLVFHKIKYNNFIAIFTTSLLFGLAHYTGGFKYVFVAFVASLGYGWIYHKTKCIEASILAHFALNLTHILLFTYPALAVIRP